MLEYELRQKLRGLYEERAKENLAMLDQWEGSE